MMMSMMMMVMMMMMMMMIIMIVMMMIVMVMVMMMMMVMNTHTHTSLYPPIGHREGTTRWTLLHWLPHEAKYTEDPRQSLQRVAGPDRWGQCHYDHW